MAKYRYDNYTKEQLLEKIKHLEKHRYGLVWEDKQEEVAEQCDRELPVLHEDTSREIKSKDGLPQNILIEGDNYHALYALNFTHKRKFDVIYIDPPYNTNSKDFKYNDQYVDKEDSYRHSKWLSFMSKRLRLAKQLLKDTGAIFISINEEELCQLKLLCDAIFFQQNYLANFTIKVRHEDRILKGDKDFHEVVEYLLLYRKNAAYKTTKRIKDNTSIAEYVYGIRELNRKPKKVEFGNKEVAVFKPGEFEITKGEPSEERLKKINIRGSIKEGNSSGRFFMKYLNSKNFGYLYKVPDMGGDDLGYRYFLTPASIKKKNGNYFQGIPINKSDTKEFPYPNYFDFEEDFNNVGYEGGVDFRNGKKPINFLLKILEIGGCIKNKKAIILDFFAGSGSLGEAVLKLNQQDGGKRQFILCTNNENKICEEVTYPRIKKVIKGYNGNEPIPAKLKYFKTAFVPQVITDNDKRVLVSRSTELLCLAENTFELMKKSKKKMEYAIYRNTKQLTAIIYDEDALGKCKKELEALKPKEKTVIYVFSYDHEYYKEDFEDLTIRFDVKPIPEAILNVYRRNARLKRK